MITESDKKKSLLVSMQEEDNDVECLFLEFIQMKNLLTNKDNTIFCFFEGKDYQYYCQRIKMYISGIESVRPITCKGKSSVIELNKMINEQSKNEKERLLFFVDRDFDDNSRLNKNIYVTPCYSIENFYIKDRVIEDFLYAELGIHSNDKNDMKEHKNAIDFFKEKRGKFINDTILLNAWYSLQRKHGFTKVNPPNLSEIKERKKLPSNITIEVLKKKTKNYIEIDNEEIELEKNRLLKDPLNLFRGKYFLELLQEVLETFTTEEATKMHIFKKKRKVNFTIGKNNLISLLSQYAETPESLKKYLSSKCKNIC